jgi:hypothetical protein
VDWDRLVDRYAIANEQVDHAERLSDVAVANAKWLARPRLKLQDESRRVVWTQNARRMPPPGRGCSNTGTSPLRAVGPAHAHRGRDLRSAAPSRRGPRLARSQRIAPGPPGATG